VKLNSELSRALAKVQRLRTAKDSAHTKELTTHEKEHQAFESRASALAHVYYLKKIHKKV